MTEQITQLDSLPEALLDCPARDLHRHFPQPTLIHLPGRRPEPLFVTLMLHGNEVTGLLAIQALLKRYRDRPLPRALTLFLGNTAAAQRGLRRLDGQPDFNRVWPGTEHPPCPETRLMARIVEIMRQRHPFASVDLHNNTGMNPHYACVNVLENRSLQLATLFSRVVVYFVRPRGTQSAAMATVCPAVTLECGKPGEPHGVEHATDYVDACLHLSTIPDTPVPEHDIDLFHTVAQVKIPGDITFTFHDEQADLAFVGDLERMNFQEIPEGTVIAYGHVDTPVRLEVVDEQGNDVADTYFSWQQNNLELRREVMPSMLTRDERVIRQDCLCYLMERLPHQRGQETASETA